MPKLTIEAYVPQRWRQIAELAPTRNPSVRMISVLPDGTEETYDLECRDTSGNFSKVTKTRTSDGETQVDSRQVVQGRPYHFFTRKPGDFIPTLVIATHHRKIK